MRMFALLALTLSLAVSGCGKSDKKDGGGGGAAKTTAKAGSGDVASMVTGTAPTLPPEIAGLTFGMSKAEVAKILGEDSTYVSSKTNPDVKYDLRYDDDKLSQLSMSAKGELEPVLTKQWGAPIKTDKDLFWFSPGAATRAWVTTSRGTSVNFSAYEPIEKVLGEKGTDFAFVNGKPLLGMTVAELTAALGARLCKIAEEGPKLEAAYVESEKEALSRLQDVDRDIRICTTVPRTVDLYNTLGDQARFGLDGRLASIFMTFNTGKSGELLKQTAAILDAKFGGKPVEVKSKYSTDRYYFDPANKTRAKVIMTEASISLDYSRYLPVAELIGGDKPGLAIEGAHMPVGTFEQIKADDPEHYRQRGTLASLYYPPAEFNQQHTEADLLFYSKEKKTYGYRVVLHHQDNEAAGDQVFELLKAKFGEPKKDAKSTDVDVYYNFSKSGLKINARRVTQQWQLTVTK